MKRILCLLTLICLVVTALPFMQTAAQAAPRYYIRVDTNNQIVTVYDNGNTSESGIVRQMICSTGTNRTPTPAGTFTLPAKSRSAERTAWYYFPEYNCYAKWATRIRGGILFHSVLFTASKRGPTSSSLRALGSKASHGCVRLKVEDAKWIALNCPAGTKVKIYSAATNRELARRVKAKTFSRDNETYAHYMGRSGESTTPTVSISLSRGSRGTRVNQLQKRLRALGFYTGSVDSKYGKSTQNSVSAFQAAIGQRKTGKVNTALWNRIFADNAPTGTLVTLAQGFNGPAAKTLQQALTDLKLYTGALDGNFNAATRDAVKLYQQNFNLPVTGKADKALQDAAIRKAGELRARFGQTPYQIRTRTAQVSMAKVTARRYTRLRAVARKNGRSLAKLYKGARVKVLKDSGAWTRVQYNNLAGYVPRKYLSFYTGTETVVEYEPAPTPTPTATPTPTPTPLPTPSLPAATPTDAVVLMIEVTEGLFMEEPTTPPTPTPTPSPTPTATPTPSPSPTPTATPEPTEAPAPTALTRYAVTVADGAKLYAAPDAAAEPVAELLAGATLEVVAAEEGWIAVAWDDAQAWIAASEVALTDELPEIGGQEPPAAEPGAEAEPPAESPADEPEDGLTIEAEVVEKPDAGAEE